MTPILDAVRREELRKLAEGATPGPWRASETYPPGEQCVHAAGSPWQMFTAWNGIDEFPYKANAAYIAAMSPDTTLALLARIAELEAGPKVKPLEWDGYGAETPFGSYDIGRTGRYWAVYLNRDLVAEPANDEAARIAAQFDYVSRILAALLPKASVREERRHE